MLDQYPLRIGHQNTFFLKKECLECSSTFWHVDPETKYCGSASCNSLQIQAPISHPEWKLSDTLSSFFKYFNESPSLINQVISLRRAKLTSKYSTTGHNYLCAGVSAFQSLIDQSNVRRHYFSNKLLVNNQFCFRFLDKVNVGTTGRHNTGFFMLGLHCFQGLEPSKKFTENWKDKWVNLLLCYFIDQLKIPVNCIFLHADSWTDSKRGGPSVEFFINGLELGNMVYTQRDVVNHRLLSQRYLDVGLGLQRIHTIISGESSIYFNSLLYDHLRSLLMGFLDHIYPSKIGVGYNLRKLVQDVFIHQSTDVNFLKEKLRQILIHLKDVLSQEFLNQELITITTDMLKDQLDRCKLSNIL